MEMSSLSSSPPLDCVIRLFISHCLCYFLLLLLRPEVTGDKAVKSNYQLSLLWRTTHRATDRSPIASALGRMFLFCWSCCDRQSLLVPGLRQAKKRRFQWYVSSSQKVKFAFRNIENIDQLFTFPSDIAWSVAAELSVVTCLQRVFFFHGALLRTQKPSDISV